jgi:hypothetical protein
MHLQHLAGVAWSEGHLDEAERLEQLARTLDMVKNKGKLALTRKYAHDIHPSSPKHPLPAEL